MVESSTGSDSNPGDEKEGLKFLTKIKSRGRPRVTKTGKLQFPKHKKASKQEITQIKRDDNNMESPNYLTTEPSGESTVVVSDDDDEDEGMPKSTETNQVCGSPRVRGQIGDNIVTKKEYVSLTKNAYVSDGVVNFMIRELDINNVTRNEDGKKSFLVLSTTFYVRLTVWNKGNPLHSRNLLDWEGLGSLWKDGAR